MTRNARRRMGAILATVFVCLVMLEGGLRIVGRRPTNTADGIAEQHGSTYRLKPNTNKSINFPAFSYTVFTNEYGFRDKAVGSLPLTGFPYDVFLGASDVFGNGVEYEDSFVGIFSAAASKKGINVLNMAIGGHYYLDQESVLKEFIETSKQKPSVVFYCVNALHIPKYDKRNENIVVKNGYLFGNKGWQLAYIRLMVGNISSAYCFFRDATRKIQERWLHYELNDKSPEFLEIYAKNNRMRDPEQVRKFEEYLGEFEDYCRDKEIEVVYVYLPISDSFRFNELVRQVGKDPKDYDVSYYEKMMREYCAKKNMKLINMRPILQENYDAGKDLRFKLDPHFNKFANRVIGDYLVKEAL